MDTIGSELALWQYNKMLIPYWSRLISVDFSVMPVTYMFIYQYFRGWRAYVIACIVVALVYAFGAEPILVSLGIYQPNIWRHLYSFPVYLIIALSSRTLVEYLDKR